MKQVGFNRTTLAEHWGMTRQTIGSYCKAAKVDTVYAEAIKAVAYEEKMSELADIVKITN